MKRFLIVGLGLLIVIVLTASCSNTSELKSSPIKPYGVKVVAYDSTVDYMALMENCAEEGTKNSLALGAIFEEQRNMKISDVGSNEEQTCFFDSFDAPKIKERIMTYTGKAEDTEGNEDTLYYTEEETAMLAKVLYRECRGIKSDTEKACVAWTVCNRVGADGFQNSIREVIQYPGAFAYIEDTPVTDELYDLAADVLARWNAEKNGESDVGRVLPAEYIYFSGDGKHNYFRNAYKVNYDIWDYSLPSPYES